MKKSLFLLILITALFSSGCKSEASQDIPPSYDISKADEYMVSVAEESDRIKNYLKDKAITQTDMNEKSQELYQLWDSALNYLWSELKTHLPEEEFASLQGEQIAWIAAKEAAAEEAGKGFEGGSIYPLLVNSEAARLTEARAYELYTLLEALSSGDSK